MTGFSRIETDKNRIGKDPGFNHIVKFDTLKVTQSVELVTLIEFSVTNELHTFDQKLYNNATADFKKFYKTII